MGIPRPSVTTTNMQSKGFRCHGCLEYKPVVTLGADGKQRCDECQPEKRKSLVTVLG